MDSWRSRNVKSQSCIVHTHNCNELYELKPRLVSTRASSSNKHITNGQGCLNIEPKDVLESVKLTSISTRQPQHVSYHKNFGVCHINQCLLHNQLPSSPFQCALFKVNSNYSPWIILNKGSSKLIEVTTTLKFWHIATHLAQHSHLSKRWITPSGN